MKHNIWFPTFLHGNMLHDLKARALYVVLWFPYLLSPWKSPAECQPSSPPSLLTALPPTRFAVDVL